MEKTLRERVLELLRSSRSPLTAPEIRRVLGLRAEIKDDDVYEAIRHVARSLRSRSGGGLRLVMIPPACRHCGYVFRINEPKRPTRCPRCKRHTVSQPAFKVVGD